MALRIQALIPNPNLGTGVINNALFPFPSTRHTEIPAFKIDHSLGSKAKFSYYWSETLTRQPVFADVGRSGWFTGTHLGRDRDVHYRPRAARQFRLHSDADLLFHFGAGYQTDYFTDDPVVTNFNPQQALGLSGVPVNRLFPYITGLCPAGTSNGTVTSTCGGQGGMKVMGPTTNRHPLLYEKPTFNTSMTWVHGNHTYKAGGELRIESNSSTLFRDHQTARLRSARMRPRFLICNRPAWAAVRSDSRMRASCWARWIR